MSSSLALIKKSGALIAETAGSIAVAAFTGGHSVPSARFRVRQHIDSLRQYGVRVSEMPSRFGTYPPYRKILRPLWAVATMCTRVDQVCSSYKYDVTLLQREILSRHITLESFCHSPRVLDVDDAIWLGAGESFTRRLSSLCRSIICGNEFLATHFRRWCDDVCVVPTAVDTARFTPLTSSRDSNPFVIGWSGVSSGLRYLYEIEAALARVLQKYKDVRLRIVSDRPPTFSSLPGDRFEWVRWSADTEVKNLQSFSVGLMPLSDSDWARGKCSYKMLLYMACAVPIVVSPVGMNSEVLALGASGLSASNREQWADALEHLICDSQSRVSMGENGRRIVESNFSLQVITPRIGEVLRRVARSR